MNKSLSYPPKAFFIIYLISIYSMLLVSVIMQQAEKSSAVTFLSFALPQVIHLLVIGIYSAWKKVDVFSAIPIKVKMAGKKYVWTVLTIVGFFSLALLVNFLLMSLFSSAGITASVQTPPMTSAVNIILGLIIICILPALGEEMLFRGVLVSSFREYGGVTIILLSGLFFSLSHFNLAQTVYQLAIGMILCYIYLKTGNLFIPIIIHFLNNAIALFLPSVIPFFANIRMEGATFAVLVPMFIVGLFVFVLAVRKLVGDIQRTSDIIVYEYQPEDNEFIAVATEKPKKSQLKRTLAIIKRELLDTVLVIGKTFKKGEIKKRMNAFREQYPKLRRLNNIIKVMLAVIIGLWIITILL